jgi:hypothetical protein
LLVLVFDDNRTLNVTVVLDAKESARDDLIDVIGIVSSALPFMCRSWLMSATGRSPRRLLHAPPNQIIKKRYSF